MKAENRKIDLFHEKNNFLKNELVEKNKITKSLMETKWTVFDSLSSSKNNPAICINRATGETKSIRRQKMNLHNMSVTENK